MESESINLSTYHIRSDRGRECAPGAQIPISKLKTVGIVHAAIAIVVERCQVRGIAGVFEIGVRVLEIVRVIDTGQSPRETGEFAE